MYINLFSSAFVSKKMSIRSLVPKATKARIQARLHQSALKLSTAELQRHSVENEPKDDNVGDSHAGATDSAIRFNTTGVMATLLV
jgi:hypothetical protein